MSRYIGPKSRLCRREGVCLCGREKCAIKKKPFIPGMHGQKGSLAKPSEYAKQFREIPPDVDQIIVEHHERPDGTGFPRGLFHSKVSPLSALFIIAHDILHYLQINQNVGMKEFIEARAEVYSQGSFKNIFKSIEHDFLKKTKVPSA